MRAEIRWKSVVLENLCALLLALLLAFLIRTFLFQSFNIPSGSMRPTLLVGDYLFVSKYSYGYNKYSFPLHSMIPWSGRILAGEPARGDVIVFRPTTRPNLDYIKRVIGIPGDRVQIKMGQLFLNGKPVKREWVQNRENTTPTIFTNTIGYGQTTSVLFRETLPNGVSYLTLQSIGHNTLSDIPRILSHTDPNNTIEYLVPKGHYFVLGDNRNNSQDSRFLDRIGYIPSNNIVGKAQILFYSVNTIGYDSWLDAFFTVLTQPWRIRLSRMFTKL